MSDFFGRLAARTLNAVPLAEPRHASHNEPPNDTRGGGLVEGPVDQESVVEHHLALDSTRAVVDVPSAPAAHLTSASGPGTNGVAVAQAGERSPPIMPARPETQDVPLRSKRDDATRARTALMPSAVRRSDLLPDTAHRAAPSTRDRDFAPPATRSNAARASTAGTHSRETEVTDRRGYTPSGRSAPATEAATTLIPAPPSARPAGSVQTPDAEHPVASLRGVDSAALDEQSARPRPPRSEMSLPERTDGRATRGADKAEGPPVVRVTIGRVEVKAAHPDPTPQVAAAAPDPGAPRLSLEDYLERRKATWR
jgi:hypothetical protein